LQAEVLYKNCFESIHIFHAQTYNEY